MNKYAKKGQVFNMIVYKGSEVTCDARGEQHQDTCTAVLSSRAPPLAPLVAPAAGGESRRKMMPRHAGALLLASCCCSQLLGTAHGQMSGNDAQCGAELVQISTQLNTACGCGTAGACTNGVPDACSAGCDALFMPFYNQCTEFITASLPQLAGFGAVCQTANPTAGTAPPAPAAAPGAQFVHVQLQLAPGSIPPAAKKKSRFDVRRSRATARVVADRHDNDSVPCAHTHSLTPPHPDRPHHSQSNFRADFAESLGVVQNSVIVERSTGDASITIDIFAASAPAAQDIRTNLLNQVMRPQSACM